MASEFGNENRPCEEGRGLPGQPGEEGKSTTRPSRYGYESYKDINTTLIPLHDGNFRLFVERKGDSVPFRIDLNSKLLSSLALTNLRQPTYIRVPPAPAAAMMVNAEWRNIDSAHVFDLNVLEERVVLRIVIPVDPEVFVYILGVGRLGFKIRLTRKYIQCLFRSFTTLGFSPPMECRP